LFRRCSGEEQAADEYVFGLDRILDGVEVLIQRELCIRIGMLIV
jgi:hypothetical protein